MISKDLVSDKDEWRLFLKQPVPTYIVDLKPVIKGLRALNFAGLVGLDDYLLNHPELVKEFLRKIKIIAVNPAALSLCEAANEQAFIEHFPDFFTDESIRALRSTLVQLADANEELSENTPIITCSGRKLCVQFYMRPLYDGDLSQVICNFIEISYWKRAEEALGREQQTLKGSPVFSFRWRNVEGWPVESVSPNIVQLGYTPDELLTGGVPFAEMVHPEDLQRVGEEVMQYSATGQNGFEQEYRIFTASGEVRWIYDYTSIIRDPNGEITHYDGFLLDITSRKQAEQALRASEQRYQDIFESNPVAIWVEDISGVISAYDVLRQQGVSDFGDYFRRHPELIFELAGLTRVVDINAAAVAMFEADSKEQLLGSLGQVFCAESLDGSSAIHTALAEGRQIVEVETVNQTLRGRRLNVLIKINIPVESDYRSVLVTLVDITARKTAEEKLANSEKELDGIYSQLLDTYYRTDAEGRVVRLSPAVEELLGYTEEEGVGRKIVDYYVEPEDRSFMLNQLVANGGVLRNFVAPMRHKDGHEVWCMTNARFVYDPEDVVVGIEGTTRDVSDRYQMEQDLRQARDLAEQANRLKGDFLANMSHEIRTPMNGVVGFVNLLSRTDLDSEQRDYVETMKTSMGDLLSIINDILDFSRIESNKLTIHNVEFDLLEATSDVVSLFSAAANAKGLNISMSLADNVPLTVEGDPVRLRQVLGNLIGNAVKFTEQGSININVSVDSSDVDQFVLCFEVEDSGVGIDAADLEKLFDAFTQMHTGRGGGTGLGLAISRRLVELMGGTLTVRQRESGGSIFTFTLPLKRLQQEAQAYPMHPLAELPSYAGKRVLVVDDNVINRKLITTLLGKMGVATVEAEDGHVALACHGGDCFDLVLMDIRMPGMDGVEATRQIRIKEQSHQRIPIIALTAHALPHEREKFTLAGMDDCLTKPVREEDLFQLLQNYMG